MTVKMFAILKEHYPAQIHLLVPDLKTVAQLKQHLEQLNPEAAPILAACRFAINDAFVPESAELAPHDEVCVIPPSSGG